MGRPYDYAYQTAGHAMTGAMQCAGCGQQIVEGEYRSYKRSKHGDWGYVTHHRDCCSDDPRWRSRDQKAERQRAALADLDRQAAALVAHFPGFDVIGAVQDAALAASPEAK